MITLKSWTSNLCTDKETIFSHCSLRLPANASNSVPQQTITISELLPSPTHRTCPLISNPPPSSTQPTAFLPTPNSPLHNYYHLHGDKKTTKQPHHHDHHPYPSAHKPPHAYPTCACITPMTARFRCRCWRGSRSSSWLSI